MTIAWVAGVAASRTGRPCSLRGGARRPARAGAGRGRAAGGHRRAAADRPRAARHHRPLRVGDDGAGGAVRRRLDRPTRRGNASRSSRSSAPAARRWPRCAAWSGMLHEDGGQPQLRAAAGHAGAGHADRPASAPPGCRSTWRSRATPATLPPGVDLAAYRVVQEALTNTLKHAGPAQAWVQICWTDPTSCASRSRTTAAARRRAAPATAMPGCASAFGCTAVASRAGRAPTAATWYARASRSVGDVTRPSAC